MLIGIGFILVALGAVMVEAKPVIAIAVASLGMLLMELGKREAEHDEA
jgi:hypothetical protein